MTTASSVASPLPATLPVESSTGSANTDALTPEASSPNASSVNNNASTVNTPTPSGLAGAVTTSGGSRLANESAFKKKTSRTLTPAQLAKKRANDREAQRAIRERTKSQIETLECRVKELESGDGFQRLQQVLKEKDVVLQENKEIKRRLVQALELLKPIVDADMLSKLGEVARVDGILSYTDVPSADLSRVALGGGAPSLDLSASGVPNTSQAFETSRHDPTKPTNTITTTARLPAHTRQADDLTSLNLKKGHSAMMMGMPAHAPYAPMQGQPALPHGHPATPIPQINPPHYAAKPAAPSRKRPFSPVTDANNNTWTTPSSFSQFTTAPPSFAQLPNNILPTCTFDSILNDFMNDIRQRHATDTIREGLLGTPFIDLTLMVYPERRPASDPYSMSDLTINLLKGFTGISGWPEKIAVACNMFTLMQWELCPTLENFNRIPEFLRPVEAQIKVPHPIWIDFVPWPRMRYKMVYNYPSISLDSFFIPYTMGLSLNWYANDIHSCVYQDHITGTTRIRNELMVHKSNLAHWSVGLEFAQAFPLLADTCRIVDRKSGQQQQALPVQH